MKREDGTTMTLDEEFEAYDQKHPEIWEKFEQYALELIAAGVTRYGGQDILGVIRWHMAISSPSRPWKVNQRMMSRYTRKFHANHPDNLHFFETRKLKGNSEREEPSDECD